MIYKSEKKQRKNEPYSAITHCVGAGLSIAGLVLLVVFASIHGTAWHVVAFSLFGASLIALYTMSTIYHFVHKETRAKIIMQRMDHAMIYVLIAGTYTPICLVTLRGGWGWSLFGVIWGLAAAGVSIKASGVKIPELISTALYVLMGWLISIAFVPLLKALPNAGIWWLVAGGLCYTIGAIFFSLEKHFPAKRSFGMHEIWHLFVMAGSICHFVLMFWYVL